MRRDTVEITIDYDELNRRFMRFWLSDRGVVLDYDADEARKTKRHKWQRVSWWSRLDQRDNTIKERRPVHTDIKQRAIESFRSLIEYSYYE